MKPTVEVVPPKAPTRRRKPTKPRLPGVLDAEVTRIAEEIVAERNAEARRIAAIELANRLLQKACDLLANANGGTAPAVAIAHMRTAQAPTPAAPVRPCTWCGQEGVRRNPVGGGWLCRLHAAKEIAEQREEALSGSLVRALKNATPMPELPA